MPSPPLGVWTFNSPYRSASIDLPSLIHVYSDLHAVHTHVTIRDSIPPQRELRQLIFQRSMLHNPPTTTLPIRSANASTAEVLRKPVNGNSSGISIDNMAVEQTHNSPKNGNRYQFTDDQLSPSASVRNSYVDNPAMDPQVRLEEYDWEELEEQFSKRMEAFKAVEQNIWQEWREWGEVSSRFLSTIRLSRMDDNDS